MKKPIPASAKIAMRFGLGILGIPLFIVIGLALFVALIFLCIFLEYLLFSPHEPMPYETIGSYQRVASCHLTMFQDAFDYREFVYRDADFTDNPYFTRVTPGDMDTVRAFAKSNEGWIKSSRDSEDENLRALYEAYDFEPECISADDYIYIEKWIEYNVYTFYYFDSESMTLYYFHDKL